jgi:hypothetical protein
MAKSIFICLDVDGLRREVLADSTDTIEYVLKLAAKHYKVSMRDIVSEKRLARAEEYEASLRFGWALRLRRKTSHWLPAEDI